MTAADPKSRQRRKAEPDDTAVQRVPSYRPTPVVLALVRRDLADAEAALERVRAALSLLEGWPQ